MAEYLVPHSKEAEEAVLGCMLIDSEAVVLASEKLIAENFYDHRNQVIYGAMMALFEDDVAIDLITLVNYLETRGELKGVGGDAYLAALGSSMVTTANVEEYIDIVKEKYILRTLGAIGGQLQKDASLEVSESEEMLSKIEAEIMEVGQNKRTSRLEHIKDVLTSSYEDILDATTRKGALIGLSTGFKELDRMTLGFQKSQLIVIGARPGDGKTSLAMNIATHVGIKEKGIVAVFNLEMSATQLVKRMICSVAMVDMKKASEGTLKDDEMDMVHEAVRTLTTAPIYIDDTAGIGVAGIRSKCRRLKMRHGLSMVVIDYLQLIKSSGKRKDNRQQEVADISRDLKLLARELDVPIVVLSQLRREAERQKKPMMSDLRESGAIEQDADTIILIHRYQDEETENDNAELIVAKQRSGPTGSIEVGWRGDLTKFICKESFAMPPGIPF